MISGMLTANVSIEAERARIVAILRDVAERIERMPVHGIPEALTFVRSVADALAAWSDRVMPVGGDEPS